MVFHKRLDYGSSGCQVPVMIRVPKSARGKRSVRKKVEDQMCAFDLLATVAGELLSEKTKLSTPNKLVETPFPWTQKDTSKEEERNKEKQIKPEPYDQGSCNESTFVSEDSVRRQLSYQFMEQTHSPKATFSGPASLCIKPYELDKDGYSGQSIIDGNNSGIRTPGLIPRNCDIEEHSPGRSESSEVDGEHVIKTVSQINWQKTGDNAPGACLKEDPMEMDVKPTAFVSSDSSVEVPLCTKHVDPNGSFPMSRVGMEPVDREEEDNSSGCTHPSAMTSKAARLHRIGDRRVRKLLASKYWKVASATSKGGERCNTDAEMKPFFRSRKLCYTRQRTQRSSFKRRKMLECYPISASAGGIKEECMPVSVGNHAFKAEGSHSSATLHGANAASSSTTGDKPSCQKGDFRVKLSIKSFKVPELFIEIPETATVGSLKRTVMEAVTAILGGGLRVGVLLQGKKVRDDNKTLLQAGISHDDKIDNLGFMLEPNPTQAPPPVECQEHPHFFLPCDAVEPLNRIPPAAATTSNPGPSGASPGPPLTSVVNCPESDHDSVHSPATALLQDKATANSRALVPVPAMDVEALAVVPLRKSKRSELVQRRIRRPFSVSEVEALVQAVEKLGTGRWRDVKLRAFDNAKHRTYVDLKDKWKTLVHTARISPQQRRGEPVPQELLDRVLSANAYWSQQQAKLQVKPPPAEPCLLL
ncbi:hypothetical protein J5N97_014994 [Dioscorea zingiberensis]|uniref:Uncharacterized protein n=1 Tax=Dioscorea zingiberensis TaxID=325984 RepID=A0A9D5CTD7_9LILI|nr:hypothetical protein J5N97_014994 [Dioscorea zingiberensis]